MGFLSDLFGGKELRLAAENELTQKLAKSPVLEDLINTIMTDEENEWIRKEQGSTDKRDRMVEVTPEGIRFKWSEKKKVRNSSEPGDYEMVDEIREAVFYNLHDSGYAPFASYPYDSGKKQIPVDRVCELFAELVREQMAAKLPKARFGEVGNYRFFFYYLPDRELKNIF